MKYKATLGLTARITTVFVTLVLAGIIFAISNAAFETGSPLPSKITAIIVSLFIVFGYVWAYIHRPLAYFVFNDRIVIQRLYKKVVIKKEQIKDAFIVRKETFGTLQKNGGNAGLFGFFGEFNTAFGRTMLYATRLDKLIMIQTLDSENIVITPDDTMMINEIKKLTVKDRNL